MAAWLLYLTGLGAALGLAARLAEGGLRRLGRPVRWAWAAAMAATVGLPLVLAGWGLAGGPDAAASASAPASASASAALTSAGADRAFLVVWAVLSLVLLANLHLARWTLRRNGRWWRRGVVVGQRVAVSAGFGPGVIGARRPEIVVPRWLLGEAASLQRLVVEHEREHVRAGDARLLLAGLLLATAVPWCLPLWWQLHRLRGAIEVDCDGRVVRSTGDARAYARALVAVAGERRRVLLPVPTLAREGAELERRIRRITERPRGGSTASGLARVAAAGVVAVVAALAPVPGPPVPLERATARAAPAPRAAAVILSVERGR